MKAQRFFAETSREALRQIKDGLGPDAVILANRRVEGGVEIVAMAGGEIAQFSGNSGTVSKERRGASDARPSADQAPPAQLVQQSAPDLLTQNIVAEIKMLRGLMEEQLAGLAWGEMQRREPAKAKLLRLMLNTGFSALLSRQVLQKMPAGCDFEKGLKWIKAALAHNLRSAGENDSIVDRGGVYALVGPTGVGKTTTTAKLAARCVVKHGADKLVLLTTDSYRIGGHEQLRIYGRLLGVAVHAVKDAEDLRLTLAELRHKHMVLIDTVGVGQRDQVVLEQETMLNSCGAEIKRMLLLNATCNGSTLDDVVRAFHGESAHGCIITKTDEAASLGVVLDAVVRHRLVLHYAANGQKVPEDLHAANAPHLIHSAFKPQAEESPFALSDNEFSLVASGLAAIGGAGSFVPQHAFGAGVASGVSLG
ncbi:MAG: flagellar biosynthesis protein FlhF [Burkholderiales bacterium]|nr:flagellar biosynthesis protein FlhF [Burkholderiales bacterium]